MNNLIKKFTIALAGICVAVSLVSVSASAGTGPYRRVSSKAGTSSTPYTYMETKVFLPMELPVLDNVVEQKGTGHQLFYVKV